MAADPHKSGFEALVLPQLDAAYSLARWLTRNPSDAEDVVQDALVRMLRFVDSYRGGNARAWVLRIVRNTAMNWLSTNRRAGQVSLDDDPDAHPGMEASLIAPGEGGGDPAAIARRESELVALRRAIAALPIEQRETVVLRDIEGLSYREIAEILEIPIGTVMSRLSRARDALGHGLKGPSEASP